MTHFFPWDTPRYARCGALKQPGDQHAEWPDCADCQAKLREDDRAFTEFVNEPFDPSKAVQPRHFNPTAGYRPREKR